MHAKVVLKATINKKGKVEALEVTQSGGLDADKSAMRTVRDWRFVPAKCGDQPVQVQTLIEVDLRLQ